MTVEIKINGFSRFVRANNNHELQQKLQEQGVFAHSGQPRKSYSIIFDGMAINYDHTNRKYTMSSKYGTQTINGRVQAILAEQFPSDFARFANDFANNAKR